MRPTPEEFTQARRIAAWLRPELRGRLLYRESKRIAWGRRESKAYVDWHREESMELLPTRSLEHLPELARTLLERNDRRLHVLVRLALDISTVDDECERYQVKREAIYHYVRQARQLLALERRGKREPSAREIGRTKL